MPVRALVGQGRIAEIYAWGDNQVLKLFRDWCASELIQALRALFHQVYLRRYFQLRPAARQELDAWQLPVAAARLSEDIPEERERVLDLVRVGLHARGRGPRRR